MKQKNLPDVVPELFDHEEFGQFRYIKRGVEIWFVAIDLCRVLGYSNPRDALAKHVPDKYKNSVTIRDGIPGNPNMTVISEPGLYRLIMRSNLPAAEKFMDWVCEKVLPSIRKYGFYRVQQPGQEKVYVEITGDKYFKLFEKKYPEIALAKLYS